MFTLRNVTEGRGVATAQGSRAAWRKAELERQHHVQAVRQQTSGCGPTEL